MGVPEQLRQAIDDAVSRNLRAALEVRGLLLTDSELVGATASAAASGATLLTRALEHWYPEGRKRGGTVDVEFDDPKATAARVHYALAFGSATATLLAPADRSSADSAEMADLACAVLNLGVGLVDGLCDGVPQVGSELLRALGGADVCGAAQHRRPRGWLLGALQVPFAADPTVAFTARVIESFFDLVHVAYPGARTAAVRAQVGALLEEALEAERQSVEPSGRIAARDHLVECSRRTSVWPFRIIELVATGDLSLPAPTAGALLGEALWRIDDLVDLAEDASAGALNALLVTAAEPLPSGTSGGTALEAVLTSGAIARAADQAAEALDAGLRTAPRANAPQARQVFTSFAQRYAGLHASGGP